MAASDARAGTQDARPGGLRLFTQYAVAFTQDNESLERLPEERFLRREYLPAFRGSLSDSYVLATIFFAAVLFFAGLATKFTSVRVALGALAFGTFVFLAGLTRLITLPFH